MYMCPPGVCHKFTELLNLLKMIIISENIYHEIAKALVDRIGDKDFFNGTVEYDAQEYYSALICTVIVCRDPDDSEKILSLLPVWWDYRLNMASGEEATDFCWTELDRHIMKLT